MRTSIDHCGLSGAAMMAGRPVVLGRRWYDEQERAARPWPALLIGWRRRIVLVSRQRTTAALGAGAGRSSSSSASIRSSHYLTLLTAVCVRAALCVVCVGDGHGIDGTTTTTVTTAMKRIGRGEHRIRDRSAFVLCCCLCVPSSKDTSSYTKRFIG